MGYTTEFEGEFKLDRPLTAAHSAFLQEFSGTRRMDRKPGQPCPIRDAAGLPDKPEYFVSGGGLFGQEHDASVTSYNNPPPGQPGLWCSWEPNDDGSGIRWNQCEKFYRYTEWLQYLIEHFLKPWGYELNGNVEWFGEDREDVGELIVSHNIVTAVRGKAAAS